MTKLLEINDQLVTDAFEANQYIREHKGLNKNGNRDTDEFGNLVARIPYTFTYYINELGEQVITSMDLTGYNALIKLYPDLDSKDPEISKKAWNKFLGSNGRAYSLDGSIGNMFRKRHSESDGPTIIVK